MAFTRDLSGLNRSLDLDQASITALVRRINKLPEHLRKAAERAVLRAGAKPILKEMRDRVPVKTGNLKSSLKLEVRVGKSGGSARVGPKSGVKYRTKNKTGRRGKSAGKSIEAAEYAFYLETGTPNMAPRPFIRPAIDAAADEILTAMAAGLDGYLTRVVASLRSSR